MITTEPIATGSKSSPLAACQHPQKTLVSREQARAWTDRAGRLTRKYDGEFCQREIAGRIILCEHVRPKSGGFFTAADRALLAARGEFYAMFDVVAVDGQDISMLPLSDRERVLTRAAFNAPANVILAEWVPDIETVFAAGGEGVCLNTWDSPYGVMQVWKMGEIFNCRVTSLGNSQSVEIEIIDDASPITHHPSSCRIKLGGGKCDQVRIGSLIRVEGMGLTERGKIREPRPCREWLVKY